MAVVKASLYVSMVIVTFDMDTFYLQFVGALNYRTRLRLYYFEKISLKLNLTPGPEGCCRSAQNKNLETEINSLLKIACGSF